MATSSFAVGSVSVAIVWGTFFYPPPPDRSVAPSAASMPARPAPPVLPVADTPAISAATISSLDTRPGMVMVKSAQLAVKH